MARLRYNNVQGTLGAQLASGAGNTALTLAATLSSNGTNVPTIAAGDHLVLILEPGTTNEEIIYIYGASSSPYTAGATSATVLRAQEGTTANLHANGSPFINGPTTYDTGLTYDSGAMAASTASYTAPVSGSFPSIPFSTIEIDVYVRSDAAASNSSLSLQFNGDTGANYDYQWNYGGSGSVTVQATGATVINSGNIPAANAAAKNFSHIRIVIPNFTDTTHDKAVNFFGNLLYGAYGLATENAYSGGAWWHPASPAAITYVTLKPVAGNLVAGSRVIVRLIP